MLRRVLCLGFAIIIGASGGCAGDDFGLDWFRSTKRFDPSKAPAPSTQAASRVHAVGSALVAANGNEVAQKPTFFTVGIEQPLIFHEDDGKIIISDGLVERCKTDAELAAVFANELGKMKAEQFQLSRHALDRDLPPAPRLTSDIAGSSRTPDQTYMAEQGYADRRSPRSPVRHAAQDPGPNPATVAKNYLVKAGYDAEDYTRVVSLVKQAEENAEKREFMQRK